MTLDRICYAIKHHKPFTLDPGQWFTFCNNYPNRTLFVIVTTGDTEIKTEIAPGHTIEFKAASSPVTVDFVPLRPGY